MQNFQAICVRVKSPFSCQGVSAPVCCAWLESSVNLAPELHSLYYDLFIEL